MGGYGTWALVLRQPKRFAALVTICGGGDSTRVSLLKEVPIWICYQHGPPKTPEHTQRRTNGLQHRSYS
jgi:predicted peptidase